MDNAIIGKKIKEQRLKAGLTQKELAAKIGRAVITVRQYENRSRAPDLLTRVKIAEALKCKYEDIFGDFPLDIEVPETKYLPKTEVRRALANALNCLYSVYGDLSLEPGAQSCDLIKLLPSAQPFISDDGTVMISVPKGQLDKVGRVIVNEESTKYCKMMYEPERKKGKWISDKCSVCGAERVWYGDNPPYCPDCGADMRGKRGKK